MNEPGRDSPYRCTVELNVGIYLAGCFTGLGHASNVERPKLQLNMLKGGLRWL